MLVIYLDLSLVGQLQLLQRSAKGDVSKWAEPLTLLLLMSIIYV